MKEKLKVAGSLGKSFYAHTGLLLGSQAALFSMLVSENNQQTQAIERMAQNKILPTPAEVPDPLNNRK